MAEQSQGCHRPGDRTSDNRQQRRLRELLRCAVRGARGALKHRAAAGPSLDRWGWGGMGDTNTVGRGSLQHPQPQQSRVSAAAHRPCGRKDAAKCTSVSQGRGVSWKCRSLICKLLLKMNCSLNWIL